MHRGRGEVELAPRARETKEQDKNGSRRGHRVHGDIELAPRAPERRWESGSGGDHGEVFIARMRE